jgi:hypothetical protein
MLTPHSVESILSEDRLLAKYHIAEATEIVIGDAVVVVLKNSEGVVGIGNVVRGNKFTREAARSKCIEHALDRIRYLLIKRSERDLEKQRRSIP